MDYAYSKYVVVTHGPEHVVVHWETNDDLDHGVPTEFAQDRYEYHGPDALEKALKHTGKSRQGVGQRVFVTLDGKEI